MGTPGPFQERKFLLGNMKGLRGSDAPQPGKSLSHDWVGTWVGAQDNSQNLPPPDSVASPASNPTIPSGTAFLLCVPPHPDVISPCDRPGPGWIIGLFRLLTPLPTPHLLIGLTSRGPFSRHPQASFLPLAASLAALSAECPSCSIYLAWPECPSISLHSFVTVK